MSKTISAALLFALLVCASGNAHAQMRPLTREDLRSCVPAMTRYYELGQQMGSDVPDSDLADPVGYFLQHEVFARGSSAEEAARLADRFRAWQPSFEGELGPDVDLVFNAFESCTQNVWLDVYERTRLSASSGQDGGPLGINGGDPAQTGGQGSSASQASSTQGGSQQPVRRPAPPSVTVAIVQRLGDGRCMIQARAVATRWENEDDASNTRISTEVELSHQCAVDQLIRDVISPCDNQTDRFCLPSGLMQGGLAHGWPLHIRPSSVPWTPEIGSSTAPTPNGWTMSRTVVQDASSWRGIRMQIASCDAFTANGAKRALLLESGGNNFSTGFRGVACETIPPP